MRAIKDINFLPDYVLQRQVKAKRNATILAWVFVFAFMAGAFYLTPIQIRKYYVAQKNNELIKLSRLSDVQKKVNALEEFKRNMDKKKNVIGDINKKQVRVIANIDEINKKMPSGVILKNIKFTAKEFNTHYIVNTPLEVVDLLENLEKSDLYKKITIVSVPIVNKNTIVNIKLELK